MDPGVAYNPHVPMEPAMTRPAETSIEPASSGSNHLKEQKVEREDPIRGDALDDQGNW